MNEVGEKGAKNIGIRLQAMENLSFLAF